MSFTKAGAYTTGLVILLGLLATSSGSNAFFIALGFGLSLLTISGLLSERSMKYLELQRLTPVTAESGQSFGISFLVKNSSPTWFLFGVESLAMKTLPRFRLLNAKLTADMEARLLSLGPMEQREVHGRCNGLERGFYNSFFVVQRTLFPFGLISKFKVNEVATAVSILPELDRNFLESLLHELRDPASGRSEDREFFSHRTMNPRDSRRDLDWKKNAGKAMEQWVVRTYHTPGEQNEVCIQLDWDSLHRSPNEKAYEAMLSRVRTAAEAINQIGSRPVLEVVRGSYRSGLPSVLDFLMRYPRFGDERKTSETSGGSSSAQRLEISPTGHKWSRSA